MIVTESEREAETQAEGEAGSMHWEPDVGFDPGSPGSRPGPKTGAKPLRHPGIPPVFLLLVRLLSLFPGETFFFLSSYTFYSSQVLAPIFHHLSLYLVEKTRAIRCLHPYFPPSDLQTYLHPFCCSSFPFLIN